MRREDIADRVSSHLPALRKLGVSELLLFGSMARGEQRSGSDCDFLVRFEGLPDFDRFMDLKFLLESALGRSVDLVTDKALRPELRQTIMADLVRVA